MHRCVLALTLLLGCAAKPAAAPPLPSNETAAPASTLDAECYDRCSRYDDEDEDCTAYCTPGAQPAGVSREVCIDTCMETHDDFDSCVEECSE